MSSLEDRNVRLIAVVGARPNFIKVAPLLPELARAGISVEIAYTGSRTAPRPPKDTFEPMTFFGVEVPAPTWFMDIGTGTDAVLTGRAMQGFEGLFRAERPDAVLVVGDVSASLAAAVSAAKAGLDVVHLEAGLRCGNLAMPDEVNRVLISRVSAMHLTPTEEALSNLEDEGIEPERIYFVGNMLAEAVLEQLEGISHRDACGDFGLSAGTYVLGSFHQPENLDSASSLGGIVEGLGRSGMPAIVTDTNGLRTAIATHGIQVPQHVRIVDAVSYSDMLALQRDAAVIVTDSSGVQEEACVVGTCCVTVRMSTERRATVECGCNHVVAAAGDEIVAAVEMAADCPVSWQLPKRWDRAVSDRVVRAIHRGIEPLQ